MMNKIGLIAGGGRFPLIFAEQAKKNGCLLYTAAILGSADCDVEKFSDGFISFKLGNISKPIDFFKKNGVTKAVMAGMVRHSLMFSNFTPDFRAVKVLARTRDMRAESILREVAEEFLREGIEFVCSSTFLENLLPPAGNLTSVKADKFQFENIRLGWKLAKTLSGLDAGLTVVVCDMAVIALEAMEGTDACIMRAGEICKESVLKLKGKTSGLVVVKTARPEQDLRFDLPVIGPGTIDSMIKAGAKVLAVEALKTLILDKKETLKKAETAKIAVMAFEEGQL